MRNKGKAPFREKDKLIEDIRGFLNMHSALFYDHASRISDYFEMTCYNDIVRYYSDRKFTTIPKQLDKDGNFIYKLTSAGLPENFSYFELCYTTEERNYEFEVHHNLSCESAHCEMIYYSPDVSVILKDSIKVIAGKSSLYEGGRRFAYVSASDVQTILEAKNMNPFPELLFSFQGLVIEVMPEVMNYDEKLIRPTHIAPTLALSGRGNIHTNRISNSLCERYAINIVDRLFYVTSGIYSRKYSKNRITTKKKP
ncbi:MAG: hypothetical protein JW776_11510 [Candidatus Lokiarchaeota archaeon]|nr:hypothetical protein [Candidatus Lokiarchaeota archaeon]